MITVNNRDKLEWKEGMTVSDLLAEMNYIYSLISVTVNDIFISQEEYSTCKIPDNAKVMVFHLFHGG